MRPEEKAPIEIFNKHGKKIEDFTIENNILKGVTIDYDTQNKSIGELLVECFDKDPNYVAWIEPDSEKRMTYRQMKESSIRLALWMRQQGLGSGDVITLCSPPCLNNYIVLYATFFIGAAFNACHHDLSLDILQHAFKLTKPKVIFACPSMLDITNEAIKLANHNAKVIVFNSHLYENSIEKAMEIQKKKDIKEFKVRKIENPSTELGTLVYSSGTSGPYKCVMMTYDRVLNTALITSEITGKINDVILLSSSPHWVSGIQYMLSSVFCKMQVVIGRKVEANYVSQVIEKYQINVLFGGTGLMLMMCRNKFFETSMPRSSIKEYSLTSTGQKLSEHLIKQFHEKFPHVKLYQGYGMSETGRTSIQTKNCVNPISVGYIMPNTQIKIVDLVTGEILGPNQSGELCCKSTRMTNGYYNDPKSTAATIDKDGWLRSGDIAYYDDNGEIIIVNRIKCIIKFRDIHINITEIEELICSHQDVLDASVSSYSKDGSDYAMAFVIKVPGSKVTEQELVDLSATLGFYSILRGGVKFVDALPRTVTGKVALNVLKEMAAAYADSSVIY